MDTIEHLSDVLNQSLNKYGFELAPFLISWYNELVADQMKVDISSTVHEDCVAYCILSNPQMFEQNCLPLLTQWFRRDGVHKLEDALSSLKSKYPGAKHLPGLSDSLDWTVFVRIYSAIEEVREKLRDDLESDEFDAISVVQYIPDYVTQPVTRYPFVHMQCAGHVSGMTYFHRLEPNRIGCSLHPVYGGWFGFRGILVFPRLYCPNLPRQKPRSPIPPGYPPFDENLVNQMLDEYRNNWRGNKWRDFCLPVEGRLQYSTSARTFFETPPKERKNLVEQWMQGAKECQGDSR